MRKIKAAQDRVTVRLTDELDASVRDILERTPAQTPSEVVRRAISVYHTLVKYKLSGSEIYVDVEEGGKTIKRPLFL